MPKCGVVIKPKLHRLYDGNFVDSMCIRLGNSLWVCVLISPPPNGTKVVWKMSSTTIVCQKNTYGSKVGRLLICQIWKFEWNRRGTESKKREKWGKRGKYNATATGNRTRDLSITDQMSVLTNQVHLKIQFRHRFDQKCPFTDSLHRLGSRFARTSPVPLEMMKHCLLERPERGRRYCPPGVFFASWNFCWYDLHSFFKKKSFHFSLSLVKKVPMQPQRVCFMGWGGQLWTLCTLSLASMYCTKK